MKFLISMADVDDEWDTLPPAERERVAQRHEQFQRELGAKHVVCYGMRPSGEARTVHLDAKGSYTVTEGPMTAGTNPVGGFYIVEADSIEEAVEWAKKGRFRPGPNEVRQIRED